MWTSIPMYYDELGVKSNASIEEIHKAYRHSLGELHPIAHAQNPGNSLFENERIRRIIDAYQVLSDPVDRPKYDNALSQISSRNSLAFETEPSTARADSNICIPLWQRASLFMGLLLVGANR